MTTRKFGSLKLPVASNSLTIMLSYAIWLMCFIVTPCQMWWRPCFRDQRLTQDVDKFCQELKKVVPQVVIAPFVIAYYTYETYTR